MVRAVYLLAPAEALALDATLRRDELLHPNCPWYVASVVRTLERKPLPPRIRFDITLAPRETFGATREQ